MKKILILLILMISLCSIANAEIHVYGNAILDSDDKTWTQHSYITFEESETILFLHSSKVIVTIGCEDLATFNIANPEHTIINASLNWLEMDYQTVNGSYIREPVFIEGELSPSEPYPPNWFVALIWELFGLPEQPQYYVEKKFNIGEGESLTLDLVTLFNETNGTVEDSYCRYSVSVESVNCDSCGDLQYEEVIQAVDHREEIFGAVISPTYTFLNEFVNLNFMVWAILSWLIKIFVMIGSMVFMFYCIFWLYFWVKKIAGGAN